jgi:quercetin dioxygenase-like cupin family protein
MTKLLDPIEITKAFVFKPLKKVGVGEGRTVNPPGLSFKWKITGAESGYAFAVYEMQIEPETGIPEHVHPYAEFFYVLQGSVQVLGRDQDGASTITSLSAGESAVVPINSPHGLQNTSSSAALFLSVASFEHEEAFNRITMVMTEAGADQMSQKEQAELFISLAADMQVHFIDSNPSAA